jgi:hypothetical protein
MNGQNLNTDLTLTEADKKEILKLAGKNPLIQKLYNLYVSYTEDPNKGWKNTVIIAQKEIHSLVLNKTLDITEDGYHKSLWEMLKGGATVAKTLASAKAEANIEEEAPKKQVHEDEEVIVPITPETAN